MVKYAGGALIPPIRVDRNDPATISVQLAGAVRKLILSGQLSAGHRLPSSRTFAREQGVSRTTAVNVYEQLTSEGLIQSRVGAGAFVSEAVERDRPPPPSPVPSPMKGSTPPRLARLSLDASEQFFPRIDHPDVPRPFVTGIPAYDQFPMALWARLSAQYWRRSRSLVLGYSDAAGLAELRQAIATHLWANRSVSCSPDEVFIFNGAQDAFNRIGQMLLNPGDKVWFENPGHIGARNSLISNGASLVPVPVDDEGLDVAAGLALSKSFRLAFVTPAGQHPLGMSMSLSRRLELLGAAEQCGAWIVEDDFNGELHYSGYPAATLKSIDQTGRVIYVGSFSKVMFAALRIGYVVAPPELAKVFRRVAGATMQGVPASLQSIMANFISEGHFATHIRRMRRIYAERQNAFLAAAREHLDGLVEVRPAAAGLQTVGYLAPGFDDVEVARKAGERGIILSPFNRLALAPVGKGLIMGFGAVPPRTTEKSVIELKELLRGMAGERSARKTSFTPSGPQE
jgi:GntR family transcriptional regulator / MocR family aminotransferase